MIKKIHLFFILVSALVCLGLVVGCTQTREAEKPKTSGQEIKVPSSFWPGGFWKDIAAKKGWFKEAGLNVSVIDVTEDYYASLADMIAGKMDSNAFPLFDLLIAVGDGADLVVVTAPDYPYGMDGIVAKAGIENIPALKGKRVGIAKNTYAEYALAIVLERNGLQPEDVIKKDVVVEKAKDLLLQDTVDAVVTFEPYTTEAIKQAGAKKIFDSSEIPKLTFSVDVFHRSFVEQRPEDVQAFVDVWHKTTRFIQENQKEAFGIIAEKYKFTLEDVEAHAKLDKILNLQENLVAYAFATGQESLHGASQNMIKFMKGKKLLKNQIDTIRIFDAQFIRNLEQDN
jgi:NitT/TauT family transport system substrate-binding protein